MGLERHSDERCSLVLRTAESSAYTARLRPGGRLDAYRRVFRFPIEQYYQDAGFDFSRHPYSQLAQEYAVLYASRCESCPLQPNAEAVLRELQAQGLHQFILSASEQKSLEQQVAFYGLREYFEALLGLNNVYAHSKVDVGLTWLQKAVRLLPLF